MNDSLKSMSAEIASYADEVINGRKTLLHIERHLVKKGYALESVCITMELIRDEISRRKRDRGSP